MRLPRSTGEREWEAASRQKDPAGPADLGHFWLTALDFYFVDRRPVPEPSKAREGEEAVTLPPSAVAKVRLLNAMVQTRTRPADLARAMGIKQQEVTRILDLHHTTKIDTLANAFKALGMELELQVRALA